MTVSEVIPVHSGRRPTPARRYLPALAFAFATVSCGDNHDAVRGYAAALCAEAVSCGCTDALAIEKDCVDAVAAREIAKLEALEDGGASISWECLASPYGRVSEHIRAAGCVAQVSPNVFGIRQHPMCVWGDSALGEACETHTDCEQELECDLLTKVCSEPGQVGDACESFIDCKVRSDCIDGRCVTPAVGDPCDVWCPEESYCARRQSTPSEPLGTGQAQLGVCVLKAGLDGACASHAGCQWGAYCDEQPQVCRSYLSDGNSCTEEPDLCWSECTAETCAGTADGVCAALARE